MLPESRAVAPFDAIHSDEPIPTLEEDRFFRGPLVARLADLISNTKSSAPLTIAINAPWGSGKSSFLNLLEQSIRQEDQKNENKITVVRFNPWHYNSIDDLVRTMLAMLSNAIGKFDPRIKKMVGKLFDQLADIQSSIPGTSESLGLAVRLLRAIVACFWGADKSLQDLRKELDKHLANQPKRLIVLIDDVDRLERDALRILFKMLRLVADLPNVTYILAYDRHVVEKLLRGKGNIESTDTSNASQYLEKIIQLSIDMPRPESHIIHDILISKIAELLEEMEIRPPDEHHWASIMYSGFLNHFRTIRNVKRYLNGLSITLPMVVGKVERRRRGSSTTLSKVVEEVELGDFFAIELIRLFHSETYHELAGAKDMLIRDHDNGRDNIRKITDRLCKKATNGMANELRELLQEIFPQIKKAYSGFDYSSENYASWRSDGRVCTMENFDKFFLLAVPQGEISRVRMHSIVDSLDDQKSAINAFRAAISDGTAFQILHRLKSHLNKVPPENLQVLVQVLFELGDDMQPYVPNTSGPNSFVAVPILIFQSMRRLPLDVQKELFVKGIKNGKSLWAVVSAIRYCMPSDIPVDPDALKREDWNQIQAMALERIQREADSEDFWNADRVSGALPFILQCWMIWEIEDKIITPDEINKVTSRIDNWIQSDDNLLTFLENFIFKKHQSIKRRVTIEQEVIDSKWLELFVDVETIRNRLNDLANTQGDRADKAKSLLNMIH